MDSAILDNANYVEIWFGHHDAQNNFITGLPHNKFSVLLKGMRKIAGSDVKHFQGDFKIYQHYDMHMVKKIEDDQAADIKVYQQKVVNVLENKNTQTLSFERKKVSSVLFPSTMDLHRIVFVRKLVFRINHRLFVNFAIEQEQGSEQKNYKVYINFNSSKDVDIPHQCLLMGKLADQLASTLEEPTC